MNLQSLSIQGIVNLHCKVSLEAFLFVKTSKPYQGLQCKVPTVPAFFLSWCNTQLVVAQLNVYWLERPKAAPMSSQSMSPKAILPQAMKAFLCSILLQFCKLAIAFAPNLSAGLVFEASHVIWTFEPGHPVRDFGYRVDKKAQTGLAPGLAPRLHLVFLPDAGLPVLHSVALSPCIRCQQRLQPPGPPSLGNGSSITTGPTFSTMCLNASDVT